MTTADEQAFLAAIVAAPDDDTPRLVFADWLDERAEGDDAARAALIRAQCQLEHLAPATKPRRALEKQAKTILKEHGGRWTQALRDAKIAGEWAFRRGFLDGITMSATVFAQKAKALFALAPTICTARFPIASNEVARLAGCEYLGRLASVDISDMCGCGHCPIHNDLRALFNSKHTQSLTTLNIADNRMDAAGAKRLAASKALAGLTALDLSENPLGAEGILALGKSKHLKQLNTLNLYDTGLGESGVEALAALTNLPALKYLDLSSNRIASVTAIRALVASPLVAQLSSLNLSYNYNLVGVLGAKVLAALPPTTKLEALDVRHCGLTENAIRTLKARFSKVVNV